MAEMTNAEILRSMPGRELAWFLMLYADKCGTCIYNGYEQCKDIADKMKCIDGTSAWLARVPDKTDLSRYAVCTNNRLVEEREADR